jgi:hypothetical protein
MHLQNLLNILVVARETWEIQEHIDVVSRSGKRVVLLPLVAMRIGNGPIGLRKGNPAT